MASTSILTFSGPWCNSCSVFTLTWFVNTRGCPSRRTSAHHERSICPWLGRFDAMLWAGDRHASKKRLCNAACLECFGAAFLRARVYVCVRRPNTLISIIGFAIIHHIYSSVRTAAMYSASAHCGRSSFSALQQDYVQVVGVLRPASALLMGCVGRAPPTPTELQLAFFGSVQKLLGHRLSWCIALLVGCMLCIIVWWCKGKSCQRRKGAPLFTRASPGTV
jgi:hypothetical protein